MAVWASQQRRDRIQVGRKSKVRQIRGSPSLPGYTVLLPGSRLEVSSGEEQRLTSSDVGASAFTLTTKPNPSELTLDLV